MSSECNKPFCNKLNWVQDEQNSNHYVCLKCDAERWIGDRIFLRIGTVFLQILALLFVVILLLGCESVTENRRSPYSENQETAETGFF